MIELEITQYIPINLNNYVMKYKKIKSNKDTLNIQVILILKDIIRICNQISINLKSRKRELNVNCDILQKILSLNLVEDFSKEGIFIECRDREFVVNMVKEKNVYESHILPRTAQSYESVMYSIKGFKNVYYYGNYDPFIKGYLGEEFMVRPLKLNNDIKLIKNNKAISKESISHINSIGMII